MYITVLIRIKKEGNFSTLHVFKVYKKNVRVGLLIFNLCEVSGLSHVPAAFTMRTSPTLHTEYEAGWAPEPV